MKKIIAFIAVAFTALQLFAANLTIRNNTDEKLVVYFRFSNEGIVLRPGEEVEVVCDNEFPLYHCKYGAMTFPFLKEDSTMELNPDCYYIGENRIEYWISEN